MYLFYGSGYLAGTGFLLVNDILPTAFSDWLVRAGLLSVNVSLPEVVSDCLCIMTSHISRALNLRSDCFLWDLTVFGTYNNFIPWSTTYHRSISPVLHRIL